MIRYLCFYKDNSKSYFYDEEFEKRIIIDNIIVYQQNLMDTFENLTKNQGKEDSIELNNCFSVNFSMKNLNKIEQFSSRQFIARKYDKI